jgi:hypothetical protein
MAGNGTGTRHIQNPARFDGQEFCGDDSIDILFREHRIYPKN